MGRAAELPDYIDKSGEFRLSLPPTADTVSDLQRQAFGAPEVFDGLPVGTLGTRFQYELLEPPGRSARTEKFQKAKRDRRTL
ncbi:hypothetical protein GCM10010306_094010 [Streptomyces umbrinus]|jgi:hypothetical protein|nr:hypothetical protein GCM10010306_094010 [Streptomyces umbrinus]GHH62537.1 hypothetical protein GCM10018775_78750 [Streptomyces umbrinus]